jgi:multidrug resistance efflux pump
MVEKAIRWFVVALAVVSVAALLAGCGGPAVAQDTPAETATPVVETRMDIVAEAEIEPARWVELRLGSGGQVAEVLVEPGDQVAAGSPLVRLDVSELEIALQSAQEDVTGQKAALDGLIGGASETSVARAARENAQKIAQAEIALRIRGLELERARADDPDEQVAAAREGVGQLQLELAQAAIQDPAPDVEAARIDLERAQIALDDTRVEYNKALDRPWEPQEVRDGWAKQLKQAELDVQRAQTQLARAQGAQRAHAAGLEVIRAQIDAADEDLQRAIHARENYTLTLSMLTAEVEAARLELEALRAWENPALDPPGDHEIAQARVRVRQAELAAERLALQIAQASLYAPPLGGATESVGVPGAWTVVQVEVRPGDRVVAGEVVAVLATLDRFQARTRDLVELDISQVSVGSTAKVTVDALPDREFAGVVREISLRSGTYRGDTVYDAVVDLVDVGSEDGLRWGMTAVVILEQEDAR